jgi:translation initiation factor IF-2
MKEVKIGKVAKFFAKPCVAAVDITEGSLAIGDTIHIKGHTTDFQQEVESMQIENEPVEEAGVGSSVGIKMKERVRPHDEVYKVEEE